MENQDSWDLLEKLKRGIRNLTPESQLYFEVNIVEHCNLNCIYCGSLSPLAEEEYLDINSYKKDCDRLSELFGGEVFGVTLMGGEPLLHPQITEFMRVTRKAFPIGDIKIVTNGLLLPSMPEGFWEACKMYDIEISPTCYPIKLDYDGLGKMAKSKGVKYTPQDSTHNTHSKVNVISSKGYYQGTSFDHYFDCNWALGCKKLKDGKIYPCTMAVCASHLKKYFNLDIHLSERDGVDIYSVKSGDELLAKLARPIPFCKYCNVSDKPITSEWRISKKDRYEWLAFSFAEDDIQYLKSRTPVVYVFGAGKWGKQAVTLLKQEEIAIKSVLATRKGQGIDNIQGVPIVTLDELREVEPNSICLVALGHAKHKEEVYPLLSEIGFGDVVPICRLS